MAGGKGSRLYPLTQSVSKHLLPIYDKPMVYYPLSVLMLAGIRDILVITTPEHQKDYQQLLGNGEQWGVQFNYLAQSQPRGIADAFILGRNFIGQDSICLILGDNLFWGQGFSEQLERAVQRIETQGGANLFACKVNNPHHFGVVEFNGDQQAIHLVEKPQQPRSDFAITGLYFYDQQAVKWAQSIRTSARGEKEITALNQYYLKAQTLHVEKLGRGFAWMDMGTPESLFEASQFVESVQGRRGYKIACLEEIAWIKRWINASQLQNHISRYPNPKDQDYLKALL